MVDLVLNHVSSQSQWWFQNYLQGGHPGCAYFVEVDANTDTSTVVRPRSSPLLVAVDTHAGTKHVWATFSADQIDLNTDPWCDLIGHLHSRDLRCFNPESLSVTVDYE